MKKVIAILLACVLVLGASMTVFAEPSPGGSADDTGIEAEMPDYPNGEVIVSQDYPTQAEADAAAALQADPKGTLEAAVGADEAKDMSLVSVMDVKVVGEGVTFPVTIRFYVPGVTTSSRVIVLHYINGNWQKESPSLGKGTVTVTFSSLSPVAIYVDNDTAAAGTPGSDTNASGNASDSTSGKSPKTGEAPIMAIVVIVAAFAAAGMTVSTRRKQA